MLRERIYLQTDKHLYLAGELIRIKLTTFDTKQIPLVFSKIAYVELVRDSVAQIQIKVAMTDGIGEGRMTLPPDLATGFYRLIAYTQYMRNEGMEVFFEKNVGIINTFQSGYYPATGTEPVQAVSPDKQSAQNTVSIQPDKPVYKIRERGELVVTGLPETVYSLSVSLAGRDIITPNSFPPTRLQNTATFSGEYLPEYEGHIIKGTFIDNQTGKTGFDNTFLIPVLSFPGKGMRLFTGQKNETGEVLFFTTGNFGTKQIATTVYNADDKYRIDIKSPFVSHFPSKNMPPLTIDSMDYHQLLMRSVALQASHYFSPDTDEAETVSEPTLIMKPANSYALDEYTRFTTMREVFIEFIANARFRRNDGKRELSVVVRKGIDFYFGSNPLVLLDGTPVANHELIYNYDPLSVEYINVYNTLCIFGGYTFEGVVELKTYRGQVSDLDFGKATQIIPYEGPQLPDKISNPDYSVQENRNSRLPDGRHTLLWNPDIRPAGQSTIRIPFDTSDLTGEFQATIEGITKEGTTFQVTTYIKIE